MKSVEDYAKNAPKICTENSIFYKLCSIRKEKVYFYVCEICLHSKTRCKNRFRKCSKLSVLSFNSNIFSFGLQWSITFYFNFIQCTYQIT